MSSHLYSFCLAFAVLTSALLGAPIQANAGVTSEEAFGSWKLRTLTMADGQKSVALVNRTKMLTGITFSCGVNKPVSVGVMGEHNRSKPLSIKEMASDIKVKVAVDNSAIQSQWGGMLIPAGFFIEMDHANDLISHMNGQEIQFDVNDIEVSFSLDGFSEGLIKFNGLCEELQASQ